MNAPAPTSHNDTVPRLYGVPAQAEALALAELLKEHPSIIHISEHDRQMDMLHAALQFFVPAIPLLRFAAWDTMPYDRVSPRASVMAERMTTLSQLANGNIGPPCIILTTAAAILQKLPPQEMMKKALLTIEKGKDFPQQRFIQYLIHSGYHRVSKAMETGEFAQRGGIIDIIPPGSTQGFRIDWFGDEVESIRSFDPLSQVSDAHTTSITLHPVSEVLLTEDTVQRFRQRYRDLFGAISKEDPLYESISSMQSYAGMEHWLPLFYEKTNTLLHYCPPGTALAWNAETATAMEDRTESILDYYDARKEALGVSKNKSMFSAAAPYHAVPPEQAFILQADWELIAIKTACIQFVPFSAPSGSERDMGYKPQLRFGTGKHDGNPFEQLKDFLATATPKTTLLACYSEGSRERLFTLMSEHGFTCLKLSGWQNHKTEGGVIGLVVLPIPHGFETRETRIFSEQDLLGERISRTSKRKKQSDVFMQEAASFNEGELVVHKEHGIGRFEGLVTVDVNNTRHDCLKLVYEGDDKLFLPVENIDMVSRYGDEEEGTRLDKLGGTAWQLRKAKLKQRIQIAAEALLKTAAQRRLRKGEVISAPGTYHEFTTRFPYAETEDQERSINEVIDDLQRGTPMDRLICGDVGFGKTEVALRAAFIAVANTEKKMQVAIITPTTLLARQHYRNFCQRFDGFDITIRQLSRMVSSKEQKDTRERLVKGEVDIVIGTHALLSKQTQFKNLGLLIVDEEQHFGVGQKEKLKELKAGVHVLTLSATPIPRTLQMALTGVRDLSLITTPPVDRLAIRSFVMPFDPVTVREAIQREIHRGGQCFVVTPRIKYMAELKAQLKELVPDARMATAHGQMAATELDKVMNEFYDGKFDILLSTAIIESGLDIPTANTIIIHNAHLFGLAQLYQMRGRVGRGKHRAYAYFLLPHHRELTRNATRRLEVMNTLDTLGAGFTLASHDMDIRGFGNLVGEEQSGHIREVGVELYQHMLEEAVDKLKRGGNTEADELKETAGDWSPQINLGVSVLIPEFYIEDLSLRMGLYRRAAYLASEEEIGSFAAELTDRFGDIPSETQMFIATLGIKILCKQAGIERIDVGPKGAVIAFRNNAFSNPMALLDYIGKNSRTLRARPDNKIVFTHTWSNSDDMLADIKERVGDIAGLLRSGQE
ncbi:MAG: transcription-repair coupling factor [Alphaproteobacteria bacterium]